MNLQELNINILETITTNNMKRIVECIEGSFSKKLKDSFRLKKLEKVFFFNNWKGLAVLQNLGGFNYLDKLAIRQEFRGSGLGNLLLSSVIEYSKSLLWRSSRENVFQEFYFKFCDGFVKTPDWNIFWINYPLNSQLIHSIEILSQLPADFE